MNKSFNGFRAIAFLAVFLFHSHYFNFQIGYTGVLAFFVLSGFLITPILVDNGDGVSFSRFYINFMGRRALRIFPLYYLYIAVCCGVILFLGLQHKFAIFQSFLSEAIYALTYTYNVFHSTVNFEHNLLLSHFWSLSVEEQFYFIWPFVIFFTPKNHLIKALIAIIISGPAIRIITAYISTHQVIPFLSTDKNLVVYLSTFSHLDAFATGALFSQVSLKRLNNFMVIFLFVSFIIMGLSINYYTAHELNLSGLGFSPLMNNGYKYIWGYTALNLCFGMILLRMKTHSFFPSFFELPVLNYLGKISYGLYVYHYAVIWLVHLEIESRIKFFHSYWGDLLALLLTIVLSSLSYYFYEVKFLKYKYIFSKPNINEANIHTS